MKRDIKIAIAHDYFNQYGGAERVVEVFHEIFPEAPIYVSIYDKKKMPSYYKKYDIRTSFLQKIPFKEKHFKKFIPLFPIAFEQFDFSEYNVVLSSSTAWAKGIITSPDTVHIAYVNNPMRFVYKYNEYIKNENINRVLKAILPFFLNRLRVWDYISSQNIEYIISNSNNVKRRVKKYWNRESDVIHPPVNCKKFFIKENATRDYFLVVSRLREYKRIDIVVKAFNELNEKLLIVGTGSDEKRLKKLTKSKNIEFIGRASEKELVEYYQNAKALIFPGEEDFGLTPVEAQACGTPVIAYAKGGALETVLENETGLFFYEQNEYSLKEKILQFNFNKFDINNIRKNALRFDVDIFKDKIKKYIYSRVK